MYGAPPRAILNKGRAPKGLRHGKKEHNVKYDFDRVVERYGTYSAKWDSIRLLMPPTDKPILPLMVADMDFRTAQPILDAMHRVADFGMYGYTAAWAEPEYAASVVRWFRKRFGWEFGPEAVVYSNGTIEALNCAVRTFSNVGDGVILCRPVYGHFTQAIEGECHRRVVDCHLLCDEAGRYTVNFEELEALCADPANRIFVLCSPHNPIGRVWTKEELRRMAAICRDHKVLLVSDEVHCDIRRKGVVHYPVASLVSDQSNIITLTAVNKSFNLAGLQCSNAIIPDPFLRARFQREFGDRMPTPFAVAALIAAYGQGGEWLEQVNEYIDGNIDFVLDFLKQNLPWVKAGRPEGTYILWLDFSASGLTDAEIHTRIYDKALVLAQDGVVHDPGQGQCFQRICVPCARSVLAEAMQRIAAEFTDIKR